MREEQSPGQQRFAARQPGLGLLNQVGRRCRNHVGGSALPSLLLLRLFRRVVDHRLHAVERGLRDLDGDVGIAFRGAQLGVAEDLLDGERAGALQVQQCPAAMPRIVESYSRDFGAGAELSEYFSQKMILGN